MKPGRKSRMELPEVDQLRQELSRVENQSCYISQLRSTAAMVLVTAAIVILAATLWLPVLQVTGNSMTPALRHGDIVVCWKTPDANPGDLVSFYVGNKLLIKRCIAGPGQKVDVDAEGTLLVDGERFGQTSGTWETELPCTVPEAHIFCLGDNRETSVDSRHAQVGCVAQEQILGTPFLRVWPLSRFGFLE